VKQVFDEGRMTHPVITGHPETPMQDALTLMHKEHIRRLPIVDKQGKLIVDICIAGLSGCR
jgi:CBS domain-containing protein